MKKIFIPLALVIVAVSSYYPYKIIKTRYIINNYFKEGRWTQLKDEYNQYHKSGYSSLFFGDSMTEDFKPFMDNSDSLVNMGISGDFSEGLIMRIDNVIHFQPDNLFIMIGINDIIEKVPLTDIEENYMKIIRLVQTQCPRTTIYIQSTLPTRNFKSLLSSSSGINNKVRELNSFLLKTAVDKGLHFIDLYPDFIDNKNELKQELTTDGIHLNEKGYSIWSSHLKKFNLTLTSSI